MADFLRKHCHIAWHISQGMSIQILEQPQRIIEDVDTSAASKVCRDWWTYTNALVPPNLVDQIDSGI